jgi:hypothetical protein
MDDLERRLHNIRANRSRQERLQDRVIADHYEKLAETARIKQEEAEAFCAPIRETQAYQDAKAEAHSPLLKVTLQYLGAVLGLTKEQRFGIPGGCFLNLKPKYRVRLVPRDITIEESCSKTTGITLHTTLDLSPVWSVEGQYQRTNGHLTKVTHRNKVAIDFAVGGINQPIMQPILRTMEGFVTRYTSDGNDEVSGMLSFEDLDEVLNYIALMGEMIRS